MKRSLSESYKEVREYVNELPKSDISTNADLQVNARRYLFDLEDRNPVAEIRAILQKWFATGYESMPNLWLFQSNIDSAYNTGVDAVVDRFKFLAGSAGIPLEQLSLPEAQQVFLSDPYRRRLSFLHNRVFEQMKGFVGSTAVDLANVLMNETMSGSSPRNIMRKLSERFRVSESRAKRIMRTEINASNRRARRETSRETAKRLEDSEITSTTQWISAILDTSRDRHVARHLKFYSIEENEEFYAVDGNEINCYCIQQDIMVMPDGTKIGVRKK